MRPNKWVVPSPIGEVLMHQTINPESPAMTEADFQKGRKIYFERCAAATACCAKAPPASPDSRHHPGKVLTTCTPSSTTVLPRACPLTNCTSGTLSAGRSGHHGQVHPARAAPAPEMGMKEVEGTWKLLNPTSVRPRR